LNAVDQRTLTLRQHGEQRPVLLLARLSSPDPLYQAEWQTQAEHANDNKPP
jgi:hypothetical protein